MNKYQSTWPRSGGSFRGASSCLRHLLSKYKDLGLSLSLVFPTTFWQRSYITLKYTLLHWQSFSTSLVDVIQNHSNMKFQTLFSLATVGLAFATPVHNLEARDDYTNCVINLAKEAVSNGCGSLPVCRVLPHFVQCMQNGLEQLDSGFFVITGFPTLLVGCVSSTRVSIFERPILLIFVYRPPTHRKL